MIKVLIIGDSIAHGWAPYIEDYLFHPEVVEVTMLPENARHTTNIIRNIDGWLETYKPDIVVIGSAIHDITVRDGRDSNPVNPQLYISNVGYIFQILEEYGTDGMWVTGTPIPEGPLNEHAATNTMMHEYNARARVAADQWNIPVADLHSRASWAAIDYQLPNNVHYTDDGYKILSRCVAEKLNEVLYYHREQAWERFLHRLRGRK